MCDASALAVAPRAVGTVDGDAMLPGIRTRALQ